LTGDKGIVFDIKHFAVHDGPGIRTTVFLKGCPLRCAWCHSPESQSPRPEVLFHAESCISCGACIEACPTGAQTTGPEKIRRELCTGCGRCADACYAEALQFVGETMTVDEVLREVERDRVLYDESGGGITLSGGEPTQQPKFATELLRRLKEGGHHTALDTCGHADWGILEPMLRDVDLVLYDIKHAEPTVHEALTGVGNELITSNLAKIAERRSSRIVVRFPVVPGRNDSPSNIKATAALLGGMAGIEAIELLPYHDLGTPKYIALGRPYLLTGLEPPTEDELASIRETLEAAGLRVMVEGKGW
jgi:pyruvate formate lyase activating enzyme